MDYLTTEQINELKQILEDQKMRLMRTARQTMSDQIDDREPVPADTIDISTGESLQITELRLRDREKYLIAKIQKALKRLEEGDYGYCLECESEIGFPRLKARPVAELCIDCKEEQERQERTIAENNTNDDKSIFLGD
jgi:DnaK suppressor protein